MPRLWKPSPPPFQRGMIAEPGKRHSCGRGHHTEAMVTGRGAHVPPSQGQQGRSQGKMSQSSLCLSSDLLLEVRGPGPCWYRLCRQLSGGMAEGQFGGANEEHPEQTLDCTWKRMSFDANLLLPLTQITRDMCSAHRKGGVTWKEWRSQVQSRFTRVACEHFCSQSGKWV